MITHLNDLIQNCFVELRIIIKVESFVMKLLTNDKLFENWTDFVIRVHFIYDLREEICLFGFFCVVCEEFCDSCMFH